MRPLSLLVLQELRIGLVSNKAVRLLQTTDNGTRSVADLDAAGGRAPSSLQIYPLREQVHTVAHSL